VKAHHDPPPESGTPPGHPGIPPRWTSSAKSGVGTAASDQSRVWFTVSHGIINEVYFPTIDTANTRDLGLLVTDGAEFFSEEKRDARSEIRPLARGVPGFRLVNTCLRGRYRIEKTILTDPGGDTLLQQARFEPLQGQLSDYKLYVLLAPHVANFGSGNDGWAGEYKGVPMLFARRGDIVLALACSVPFSAMSCGYVGFSDGWQDISNHRRLTRTYKAAPSGNIALTGEIDLQACAGSFVLALGFGSNPSEAGQQARAALLQDFDHVVRAYVESWQAVQSTCIHDLGPAGSTGFDMYRVSTAVLKTHQSKSSRGGMIASLSVPWGFSKGDDDLGGYHLVWPRDMAEAAGGLLATGDIRGAQQALLYLMSVQEPDGHWAQNMWLDGTPYWDGIQMDETAFPILLADALRRMDGLSELDPWPMVRLAASFLVCNGPVTQQDRWEEDGGYSPFTLAVEIAALLAAAGFADEAGERGAAAYLRSTADIWNQAVERWTYVTGTDLARQVGVDGYYVRIAPPDEADAASPHAGFVPIKNRPPADPEVPVALIVSPDALALVRFGLRAADDPRIVNTVRVIDAQLKSETATGPVWHRYNKDGYGEHEDGSPFDGTGVGRGWPLLAGERAHYELARGNRPEAERLARVMEAQASDGGLIPEQVWDAPDIEERELYNGRPSGSAMPLVWAHAEYIKLLRSLRDGSVFDTPPQPVKRYQIDKLSSDLTLWRFNQKCHSIPAGMRLRVELLRPAIVRWTTDAWASVRNSETADTSLGVHVVDLPVANLAPGSTVVFTMRWLGTGELHGRNFDVTIAGT
jgi:glucoamylase